MLPGESPVGRAAGIECRSSKVRNPNLGKRNAVLPICYRISGFENRHWNYGKCESLHPSKVNRGWATSNLCPTSKMSHERGRRDSCASRRRDGRDRWLWRLVGPIFHWGKVPHFKLEPWRHFFGAAEILATSLMMALSRNCSVAESAGTSTLVFEPRCAAAR